MFLHPRTSLKKRNFNFKCFLWRMSCRYHCIFTNILKSVQNINFCGFPQIFHSKLCTSHRIHFTQSWKAFSRVHFTFCAFFYISSWFVSYMAATASRFCFTMVKQCYHSTKVLSRCAARTPIRAPNAIYQIEFDGLYVMRKAHYRRWKLSGCHRGVVLKKSVGTHLIN